MRVGMWMGAAALGALTACTVETASPERFQGDGFSVAEGGKVSLASDVVRVPSCAEGQVIGYVDARWTCVNPGSAPANVVTLSGCTTGQLIARSATGWACTNPPSAQGISTLTAGDGLTGGGTGATVGLSVSFGGTGAATSVARSDHGHAFSSLGGIPAGLADGDDDGLAELGMSCAGEGEVARWTGAAFECARPRFADLDGVPPDLADGDDDGLAALAASCAGAGGVPRFAGGVFECRPLGFADLSGVPSGLADGDDDTLAGVGGCTDGAALEWRGGAWTCASWTVEALDDFGSTHETAKSGTRNEELQAIIDDLRRRLRRLEGPPGYSKIPPGAFKMGSPLDEPGRWPDEVVQRDVVLTRAFWMKQTEVTQTEWCEVLNFGESAPACDPTTGNNEHNPSQHQGCPECPVEAVSFGEAIAWLNRLSMIEGLLPCYLAGAGGTWTYLGPECEGYRLPSEAEWEWAAHARTGTTTFYSGQISVTGDTCASLDPALAAIAWYCANAGSNTPAGGIYDRTLAAYGCSMATPCPATNTQPVGGKLPNGFGLFDMLGNVAEYTNTEWGYRRANPQNDYTGSDQHASASARCQTPCVDPDRPANGNSNSYLVVKGGSFHAFARDARIALRGGPSPNLGHRGNRSIGPTQEFTSVGFRPVRTVR